jgi:hypothetical protein
MNPLQRMLAILLALVSPTTFATGCDAENDCGGKASGLLECVSTETQMDATVRFDDFEVQVATHGGTFSCRGSEGTTWDFEGACLRDAPVLGDVLTADFQFDDNVLPLGPTSKDCLHGLQIRIPLDGFGPLTAGTTVDLAPEAIAGTVTAMLHPVHATTRDGEGSCFMPVDGVTYRVEAGVLVVLPFDDGSHRFAWSLELVRTAIGPLVDTSAGMPPESIAIQVVSQDCRVTEVTFC